MNEIMKTVYTRLKNPNTGDLILKQEFKDIITKGVPIYYYRDNKSIDTPDLTGYVEIYKYIKQS